MSNYCVNDCAYCGFHAGNKSPRKKLTMDEIGEQVRCLIDMGHKRLLLEVGEYPENNPIDYVLEAIDAVYSIRASARRAIRRAGPEAPSWDWLRPETYTSSADLTAY